MISSIGSDLHTFFMPQVEQLAMRELPSAYGATFALEPDVGTGRIWVAQAGAGCLLTVLRLQTRHCRPLRSNPGDYACVGRMSRANARACPLPVAAPLSGENLMTFSQKGGECTYALDASECYSSCSVVFTSEFFDILRATMPYEAELLQRAISTPSVNALPAEAWGILDSIDPARAAQPGAGLYFAAKVNELLACVAQAATAQEQAQAASGSGASQQLAAQAYRFVRQHYGEPLTLESVAQALFVSRTRLAAVFKEETGTTLGCALRAVRAEAACRLLAQTDRPVADVARAVGYARHSSFAEAFKAQTGCSPSQWRRQAQAG